VGCYSDSSNRALPNWLINSGATVEDCVALAKEAGFTYAGLEYGGQCFAGNVLGYGSDPAGCNMPCSSEPSEICGGTWANSVYLTGAN
jgi:WSC domain